MWQDCAEPAWGSAAPARFWVAMEQPGPWGRLAFMQSLLDPKLGAALERACASAGGRALLIRAVGEHRAHRDHAPERLRVYVSGGMRDGRPWLLTGEIDDPRRILDLPFAALTAGDLEPARRALPELRPTSSSVLLLCTNAKRDACCAVVGRPIAIESASVRPDQVWECTHTGGHRFAPTGVLLPSGATLGRLTTSLAVSAVDAADRGLLAGELNTPAHHRGLSHLPPVAQAADGWVRSNSREAELTALRTEILRPADDDRPALVEVTHHDGRRWTLLVSSRTDEQTLRRNSCITEPVPTVTWHVEEIPDRD